MANKRNALYKRDDGKKRKRKRGNKGQRIQRAFYTLTAVLSLWTFAYVSGLFPYLGWGRVQNNTEFATSMDFASFNLGIPVMLLFEGQTAFYNYDSYSEESSMTFDVKPFFEIGYSDRAEHVRGGGEGRAEFPITSTGLYVFQHRPTIARGHVYSHYTVSWGAE